MPESLEPVLLEVAPVWVETRHGTGKIAEARAVSEEAQLLQLILNELRAIRALLVERKAT